MLTCCEELILDGETLLIDGLFEGTTIHRGRVHSYIGMTFDFTLTGTVAIRMDGYVEDILNECKIIGSAPSPAGTDLFDIEEFSPPLEKARIHSSHELLSCFTWQKEQDQTS